MNVLGIGSDYVAFAGKCNIYFRLLPESKVAANNSSKNGNTSHPLPQIDFSPEWKDKDGHIECIGISNDGKMIAAGDSMHGVHLFEQHVSSGKVEWRSIFYEKSEKRIIKFRFTDDSQFLTFLDKQADIFALRIPLTCNDTRKAKKIMGHTSFISDYIVRSETNQIISCDRDEKIRISNFPDALNIQGFKLGHTESVISVSLVSESSDQTPIKSANLLSASVGGTLMLWDLAPTVNGTETNFLKSWKIRDLLSDVNEEDEVKEVRCCKYLDNIFVSVSIARKVAIFKLCMSSLSVEFLQDIRAESAVTMAEWAKTGDKVTLIIYTPEFGSLRWWQPNGPSESYDLSEEIVSDLKASADIHKTSSVPMKKRLTTFEDSMSQEDNLKKAKT